MRSWKRMSSGQKTAAVALGLVLLVTAGLYTAYRFDNADRDDAVQARETVTPTPSAEATPAGKPLDLGVEAKISSNYRVAITAVDRYSVPGGQMLAATVKATYTGKEDGEPWFDLSLEFSTPGSAPVGELECPSGVAEDPADRTTLKSGDEATYVVCLSGLKEVRGGRITVQEAFTNGRGAWWSTDEAVDKKLPPAAQDSTGGGSSYRPGTSFRSPRNADNDEACEDFDEDKYEEYKDWGEDMKAWYDKNKDNPKADQDDLDDFEEWEKEYDEQIEQFEKWRDAC